MREIVPDLQLDIGGAVSRSLGFDILGRLVVRWRRQVGERLSRFVSDIDLLVAQELPAAYLDQQRR